MELQRELTSELSVQDEAVTWSSTEPTMVNPPWHGCRQIYLATILPKSSSGYRDGNPEMFIANSKIPYFKFHSCTEHKKRSSFSQWSLSHFLEHHCFFLQSQLPIALYHVKGEIVRRKSVLSAQRARVCSVPGRPASVSLAVCLGLPQVWRSALGAHHSHLREFSGSGVIMPPETDVPGQFWKVPCCCFLSVDPSLSSFTSSSGDFTTDNRLSFPTRHHLLSGHVITYLSLCAAFWINATATNEFFSSPILS